jgi:hypothetical protein
VQSGRRSRSELPGARAASVDGRDVEVEPSGAEAPPANLRRTAGDLAADLSSRRRSKAEERSREGPREPLERGDPDSAAFFAPRHPEWTTAIAFSGEHDRNAVGGLHDQGDPGERRREDVATSRREQSRRRRLVTSTASLLWTASLGRSERREATGLSRIAVRYSVGKRCLPARGRGWKTRRRGRLEGLPGARGSAARPPLWSRISQCLRSKQLTGRGFSPSSAWRFTPSSRPAPSSSAPVPSPSAPPPIPRRARSASGFPGRSRSPTATRSRSG